MISQLIQVYEGQLKIGTWELAQGIGMEHRCLKGIIRRYLNKNPILNEVFVIKKRSTKKKGGQIEEYLLGEHETRLVLALLMNHPKGSMAMNMFALSVPGPEVAYFKALEEFFDEVKEIREFEEF